MGVAPAFLAGCSYLEAPACTNPTDTVVDGLSCADAEPAEIWVERLSGRALPSVQRSGLYEAIGAEYRADPEGTRRHLAAANAEVTALGLLTGTAGAEERSHRVWAALRSESVFPKDSAVVGTTLARAVSVWASADDEHLILSEADIEGYIHYASLCREVQAGGALKLSIADRVSAYDVVVRRFKSGTPEDRAALLSLGSSWASLHDRWQEVPYEDQQAFIKGAPLPPPMTASSLGYFEALTEGDVVGHARNLHATLGPLAIAEMEPE